MAGGAIRRGVNDDSGFPSFNCGMLCSNIT